MDLDVSTNSGIANGVNAKAVGGKEKVAQGGGRSPLCRSVDISGF